MQIKYIIYIVLFFGLFFLLSKNPLEAKKKPIPFDTINVFYDKDNNSFYINDYNRNYGYLSRIITNNNIILNDCTNVDYFKYKLCVEKSNSCFEKEMTNTNYKFYLSDGDYRLTIQSTDRYPVAKNKFLLRNYDTK